MKKEKVKQLFDYEKELNKKVDETIEKHFIGYSAIFLLKKIKSILVSFFKLQQKYETLEQERENERFYILMDNVFNFYKISSYDRNQFISDRAFLDDNTIFLKWNDEYIRKSDLESISFSGFREDTIK